jgi:glycogen operon protein
VERQVPRRRPQILAWRRRPGFRPGIAASGQSDLFAHEDRDREQSINFVTCHDGFTLNDLVSYDVKHNEANGRRTGTAPTTTGLELRGGGADEQSRNRTAPQPPGQELPCPQSAGNRHANASRRDEVRRTQRGNNNAYCQDNELSWFDWSLVDKHAGLRRFVRLLVASRLGPQRDTDDRSGTLAEFLSQNVAVARGEARPARLGASFP